MKVWDMGELTDHLVEDHGWQRPPPGSAPGDLLAQHQIAHAQGQDREEENA